MAGRQFDLEEILSLYYQARFLDAYDRTREGWTRPELPEELSVDELVHAGRLAARLGGQRLSRWLLRLAELRAPQHPIVRYLAKYTWRKRRDFLAELVDFEARPQLDSGDPKWDTGWLASKAIIWAVVRDFQRAQELIGQARASGCDRAWTACCEAWVYLYEDRWAECLAAAEESWELAPGMHWTASVLGEAFAHLGRLEDFVELAVPVVETGQSYEAAMAAIHYLLALAEQSPVAEQTKLVERARALHGRLPELTPLADRETRAMIAYSGADIAMLLGDRTALGEHARHARHPFYRQVLAKLETNPDGRRIVLPYRPARQKHNTCVPTSVAAAAAVFGRTIDDDALAEAVTYGGTPTWRAMDWLAEQGFVTRAFRVTAELSRTLIRSGVPFLLVTQAMSWAHCRAAVGLDEAADLLLVHDPSGCRRTRIPIEYVDDGEAPFGPEGFAFVPADQAELLDTIPDELSRPAAAGVEFWRLTETRGIRATKPIVDELMTEFPDDPITSRFRAIFLDGVGERYQAIQLQEQLLEENPTSQVIRRELLGSLEHTHDTARILQTLAEIVRRGRAVGVEDRKTWRLIPAWYLCRYADYLGRTREGFPSAERLLQKAIRYEPRTALPYHVLGDIYVSQGLADQSILPFRLASCLEYDNDHSARALADALRHNGREAEGLAYLESRARKLGGRVKGGSAWSAWVDALGDYGRPDEAIAAMQESTEASQQTPESSGFAAEFWARMGDWGRAKESLQSVKAAGHKRHYHASAVYVYEAAGRWPQALKHAEAWIHETPEDVVACRAFLRLKTKRDGQEASLQLAEQWLQQREAHERFEELYLEQLRQNFRLREAIDLLRARLKRNPLDVWAWRELGHNLMEEASRLPPDKAAEVRREAEEIGVRVQELCPHEAATQIYVSRLAKGRGEWERAAELLLEAAELDPMLAFCYEHVWEYAEHLPSEKMRGIADRLSDRLLRCIGPLHNARGLALQIAGQFGVRVAEEYVAKWEQQTPDDPEIIEARADLWLHYGKGRSDARRAVALLEPAVERYPNHPDLRQSLSHAYSVLLDEDNEVSCLEEMLRRQPANATCRRGLAEALLRLGKTDQALELMGRAVEINPDWSQAWRDLASMRWRAGLHAEALATCQAGLEKIPTDPGLLEQGIECALDLQQHRLAIDMARRAVDLLPDGAYLWYLLATAIARSEINNDLREVEQALEKALEHNASLYDAAERLSTLQAQGRRYEQARQTMRALLGTPNAPAPIHGHLAWITWTEGKREEGVEQMVEVTKRWPVYKWAWWELMDWLEEEGAWPKVRDLLDRVHPVIYGDPRLAARRLGLLEQAGAPAAELDQQWDSLLDDYPEEMSLHLQRFDQMYERGDSAKANEIIQGIQRFHPNSSYIMARRVQCLAREGDGKAALSVALQIWQMPAEDEAWSDEVAWDALQKLLAPQAAQSLFDLVCSGQRVRRAAFGKMARRIWLVRTPESLGQKLLRVIGLAPSRQVGCLLALLDALDSATWDNGSCKADLLDVFHDNYSKSRALRYWKANRENCRRQTPVWMKIGYFLSCRRSKENRALREWMYDWREREGVEMWAISNYSMALRGGGGVREDLEELYATSCDVLTHLAHDQTVRYHACVLAEVCLRLGRWQEFLDVMDRYAGVLVDREFWLADDLTRAPEILQMFVNLLRTPREKTRDVKALTRRLRSLGMPSQKRWVRRVLKQYRAANRSGV